MNLYAQQRVQKTGTRRLRLIWFPNPKQKADRCIVWMQFAHTHNPCPKKVLHPNLEVHYHLPFWLLLLASAEIASKSTTTQHSASASFRTQTQTTCQMQTLHFQMEAYRNWGGTFLWQLKHPWRNVGLIQTQPLHWFGEGMCVICVTCMSLATQMLHTPFRYPAKFRIVTLTCHANTQRVFWGF